MPRPDDCAKQTSMAGKNQFGSRNQVDQLEMEIEKLNQMLKQQQAELLMLYRRIHSYDQPQELI